ncbi:hypothetical protein QPX17_10920, partial [Corynebacterium accolens]|nr:hypothetical protein [Corynebacterium accolens]
HVLAPDTITLHALSKGRNTTQTDLTADGKSLSTVFNEFGQHYGLYVEGAVRDLSVPRWEGILDASEG